MYQPFASFWAFVLNVDMASLNLILFFIVSCCVVPSLASLSAFSLPIIPTWLGIHRD